MIKRLGIIANLKKPRVHEALATALETIQEQGMDTVIALPEAEQIEFGVLQSPEVDLPEKVDAIVTFGGDGTFLRAARLVGNSNTPLLGINLGSLGFLAEVRFEEVAEAMNHLARSNFRLEKRRKISFRLMRDGQTTFSATALNDVVLNMGSVPRALDLELKVNDGFVGRYLADGIILATATGSTAYNLSAGGPIVHPDVDAVVLSPICPHSLGVRPMILQDRQKIEISLRHCDGAIVSADGQVSTEAREGDCICIDRTSEMAYFIRLPGRNLYRIIQEKLNWGGPRRVLDDEEPAGSEGKGSPDHAS